MKKILRVLSLFSIIWMLGWSATPVNGQVIADSIPDALKNKILGAFKHFTLGFYVDAYYNWTLDNVDDTSNLIPYSANCPVQDMVRINHAAFEIGYIDDNVRGKLALQWGDAPNLLATPDEQFIKNIRQANFGFRVFRKLWIDFGYMFNPVGFESSWAVINQISTVTVGGYFEPGSVLGSKLTYLVNNKLTLGLLFGNSFSLAYGRNTHMAGMTFVNYKPFPNLTFTYNNYFGNQALYDAEIDNNIYYNNLIVDYTLAGKLRLVGQFDLAFQTNSGLYPDTTKTASMISGFLQAGYSFNPHFNITGRYEYFNDPDGFLSGRYTYNLVTTGLKTHGFTFQFEYRPVTFGYIRFAYRYYHANPGNKVYYSGARDYINLLTLTTGIRF
jgi:hypothetical protein